MASSPSLSRSPVRADASVVIDARCSFETLDAFRAAESSLRDAQHEASARDIRRRPTRFVAPEDPAAPAFVASAKSPTTLALKTAAARRSDHAKTPYAPPSNFQHRVDSPPAQWRNPSADFVAKFRLPSNQDLRRRAALDQEGFFAEPSASPPSSGSGSVAAATQLVASDLPGARRSPPRTAAAAAPPPTFQTSVPHTARKSANVELRLETIVDQDGLLPQLREIHAHRFRDEAAAAVPFRAKFKPAPALRPMGGA